MLDRPHPPQVAISDQDTAYRDRKRAELAQGIAKLAFEIVDIAGLLGAIDSNTSDSVQRLSELQASATAISGDILKVTESLDEIEQSASASVERAQSALKDVKQSALQAQSVASWVKELGPRMQPMGQGLANVRESSTRISQIATEIRMLAINARIEAARAGEHGRGFAVVAEAIGQLSRQTSEVTTRISDQIHDFGETVATMIEESSTKSDEASDSLDIAKRTDADVAAVAETLRQTSDGIRTIAQSARRTEEQSAAFLPVFTRVTHLLESAADDLHKGERRVEALTDTVENLVQTSAATGSKTEDSQMIEIVTSVASRIGALMEEAVETGEISLDALLDTTYQPVPGTDPQQVVTGFTKFTDRILPPIQEPILDLDKRIVFCAAVDRNGYLPTHNLKFSHPQGADPVWNAANSRNRRIFDDRVGAKAGSSKAPFLLQVYRRDMGGGKTVLMKDLSAPITVKGRHWGGLRLAYKPD